MAPRRLVVRNGYEPRWSPDGTKLLFTRSRIDDDVAIFSIKADGSGQRELRNGSINYMPAWSPDGSKIAFVRDQDSPQLWVMDGDGSRETRLTRPGKEDYSPEWSPDGTKVLFTRYKSYGGPCVARSDIS
jgi:Tol biopolymer transport system component